MITVNAHKITPTIFPDGTSQVWKIPIWMFESHVWDVVWRFEEEREIIDLYSLGCLSHGKKWNLYVPYLPYGRQDKPVSNQTTFNLAMFIKMLQPLNFERVATLDAHNPKALMGHIINRSALEVQLKVLAQVKPDHIIYPDHGAEDRYLGLNHPSSIVFAKVRDQSTGQITGIDYAYPSNKYAHVLKPGHKVLIVDDICDGGATFLSIVEKIRKDCEALDVHLFVTHGIFSKGREILEDVGITLHTTNSLPRNESWGISV